MPKFITVSEAAEIAKEAGIEMSRPTIIKHVESGKLGKQLRKFSTHLINEKKWRAFINGADHK